MQIRLLGHLEASVDDRPVALGGAKQRAVLAMLGLEASRTLAVGGDDGTIGLFDLPAQRPLGTPLPAVPNQLTAPFFTRDGAYLIAITASGSAYRWDVRPASWARHACAVAGRSLTRVEWSEELPDRDYAPAC